MGIDFGLARYGISLGYTYTGDVRPLMILKAKNGVIENYKLHQIIATYGIKVIVIGDTIDNLHTKMVYCFYNLLVARYPVIKVYMMDESHSSKEAQLKLNNKRKADDAEAACVILQRWFLEY